MIDTAMLARESQRYRSTLKYDVVRVEGMCRIACVRVGLESFYVFLRCGYRHGTVISISCALDLIILVIRIICDGTPR